MSIRVLVNGAHGKMGQEVIKAVEKVPELTLVGAGDVKDNLADLIRSSQAEVVVDFTSAESGFANTKTIIETGARPVIGTTGFLPEQIAVLQEMALTRSLGGIIAPNFSIGAILMMKYAQDAAHYLSNVEIIELHHDGKLDSPSGTAIKTAQMIAEVKAKTVAPVQDKAIIPGARGAVLSDIHIHAVRLPGLVANQEVIFGNLGETLTIKHTTVSREAFMPGVILACKKVPQLQKLIYGLEQIL